MSRKKITDENLKQTVTLAEEMFENYEKKILDLSNILNFIKIITSTLNIEKMVQALLFSCQGNILVSSVSIFLHVNLDDSNFMLKNSVGYETDNFDIKIKKSDPLIKFLNTNINYVFFKDIKIDEAYKTIVKKLTPLDPEIILPFKAKLSLNGFLVLSKKLTGKDFTNSDLNFMTSIAEAAGIAIENTRLYEMATVDRMSTLYVNHYFKNRMAEEFSRSRRFKKPFSLIMMDIDHFKIVNDTYGHQAGDYVIKQIGRIIQESIRQMDIPSRYGGEEFAIILPETGVSSTKMIAERLRHTIETFDFKFKNKSIKITSSFGISLLEKNFKTKEEMIDSADQALYYSKEHGRNMVTVAHPS